MYDYSVTASQLKNLLAWELKMHKTSLHTVPVLAIPPINSTQKLQKDLFNTSSSTNTGAHWKWSQLALKLPPQEISQDKSLGTEVSVSKSLANVMLTQRRISALYCEPLDYKTLETDKTV
jgi:hypothetical protein